MARSLLIVEDNPDNRMLIHMIVQRFLPKDVAILDAQNGEEGVELAIANHPDLILMDLKLPKMDGLTAIERIKQEPTARDIPILVLSAQVYEDDIQRALTAGANGYLTKPIDVTSFIQSVKPYFSV